MKYYYEVTQYVPCESGGRKMVVPTPLGLYVAESEDEAIEICDMGIEPVGKVIAERICTFN